MGAFESNLKSSLFVKYMLSFFDFINLNGFPINESSSPLLILFCVILVFSFLGLWSVFNISIYLLSLYILSNKELLRKLEEKKYHYVIKIISFYKGVRIGFIIFEFLVLVFSLVYIISICYRLILNLI